MDHQHTTDTSFGYQKIDDYNPELTAMLADKYSEIIDALGEDAQRPGLIKTPERVAKTMQFLTHGYDLNPNKILESAMFKEGESEMVIIKDIEIYSLCEHHLLPFFGKAHIAYIPNEHIVGLSKIGRIADVFSRRFQVQERLTCQIRDCIEAVLKPQGVAVVIEAYHLCMMMRGIQKQNSKTTTSAFNGQFQQQATRDEFIKLISANLI